jgi:DNA-binding transcriptional MerR regulator
VTVKAVRHYHRVGLLPEPERDASGYRSYDGDALARLVRIKILRDAGVPVPRVKDLLDADASTLAAAVMEIDRQLRAEIRRLQTQRATVAGLVEIADPGTGTPPGGQ